jgi:hypothetical protein
MNIQKEDILTLQRTGHFNFALTFPIQKFDTNLTICNNLIYS